MCSKDAENDEPSGTRLHREAERTNSDWPVTTKSEITPWAGAVIRGKLHQCPVRLLYIGSQNLFTRECTCEQAGSSGAIACMYVIRIPGFQNVLNVFGGLSTRTNLLQHAGMFLFRKPFHTLSSCTISRRQTVLLGGCAGRVPVRIPPASTVRSCSQGGAPPPRGCRALVAGRSTPGRYRPHCMCAEVVQPSNDHSRMFQKRSGISMQATVLPTELRLYTLEWPGCPS